MNKKNMISGLLAALVVTPLAAQEVDEIIVSATGIPTPAAEIGASVDVITAADLEAKQITYLQDALKLKGINVPQKWRTRNNLECIYAWPTRPLHQSYN